MVGQYSFLSKHSRRCEDVIERASGLLELEESETIRRLKKADLMD